MSRRPTYLLVASAVVGLQGLFLVGYAVLEMVSLTSGRAGLALTTSIFFAVYGAGLLACARAVAIRHSWARSPIVLTQLIGLGLAFELRDGTSAVSAVLSVVAVVVLVCLLHPASTRALSDEPPQ